MPSLYDHLDVYKKIETYLTEEGNTISDEELNEMLRLDADNKHDLEEKLVNYAKAIKNIEAEIAPVEKEIERLRRRKAAKIRVIDRMKEAMLLASLTADIKKVEDALGNGFRRQKSPASVKVNSTVFIPPEFLKYEAKFQTGTVSFADEMALKEMGAEIEKTVDKKLVLSSWKENKDNDGYDPPEGVEIVEGKEYIKIL